MLAICGFLLLAVGLVFDQTIHHQFVNYDDNIVVYENPNIARGLTADGIGWAFKTTCCNLWMPLTWSSYLLDWQLSGLRPGGYLVTNILLHAATTVLCFLVLRRMTGDLWPSAFAAAVFAIHPLRVESVAWVTERKDVLSGLFFMLTLLAYVGYVRRPFSLVRYVAVVVLFALGLMAKPMLVTLPLVLLLLDYWPLGRRTDVWFLVLEKIPLLVLAAGIGVATTLAQSQDIVTSDMIPLSARISNALVSYVAYLGQIFYPVGLAVFYPHPGTSLPIWKPTLSLLALTGISIAALLWRRRYPAVLVGWLWYLGMLVPVIGLVQVGGRAMADRFTYLPHVGLCIALAWGTARAVASWPYRRWVCGAGSVLVLAILMAAAWRQTTYWRDSKTLWTRAIECTSCNVVAYNNLSWLCATSPEASIRNGKEAIELAQQAVRLTGGQWPNYLDTLAAAYAEAGRFSEAIKTARAALDLAVQQKQQPLADGLRAKIALYEAGKPFHQPLPAPAAPSPKR
jgi:hypothetical protein